MKNKEQCSKKLPPGSARQVDFLDTMNKCVQTTHSLTNSLTKTARSGPGQGKC